MKKIAEALLKDVKTSTVPYSRDIVKLYPKNLFAKQMLNYSLINDENHVEEAILVLKESEKINAIWGPAQNLMGYAYMSLKKYDKAVTTTNFIEQKTFNTLESSAQGYWLLISL